jgi:nucleoside-diphosphate-sugar epimerase
MKIAITGSTGFVGGYLARYLSPRHTVYAFGRRQRWGGSASVSYTSWDITKGKLNARVFADAEVVIHCAGSVSDWGSYESMYAANVTGTRNVLESFPSARQFIHLSTASVYDPFGPKVNVAEDAPLGTKYLNAYAKTKRLAEEVVQQSTLNVGRVIVRPHAIYGPRDTTLLPRLLSARRFGRFLAFGDGANRISLTYIENLAQAIELIAQRNFALDVFNVADEKTDTVKNILQSFIGTVGFEEKLLFVPKKVAYPVGFFLENLYKLVGASSAPLVSRYAVSQLSSEYTLSLEKARVLLDYHPAYDYTSGFQEVKHWLETKNSSPEPHV